MPRVPVPQKVFVCALQFDLGHQRTQLKSASVTEEISAIARMMCLRNTSVQGARLVHYFM